MTEDKNQLFQGVFCLQITISKQSSLPQEDLFLFLQNLYLVDIYVIESSTIVNLLKFNSQKYIQYSG